AHEFGLSTRVDQWVIEHTLAFMDANRRALPGLRLAIFSPSESSRKPARIASRRYQGARSECIEGG
ncbi:hypothetical protein FK513_31200, partial [Klebsiella pneumoniae]|nr:hypothetical protein [Klebsiella pneumoniae]